MFRLASPVSLLRKSGMPQLAKSSGAISYCLEKCDTNLTIQKHRERPLPMTFQERYYRISHRKENPLIYGGIAVFVIGASAQMGAQAWAEYQESKAKRAQEEKSQNKDSSSTTGPSSEGTTEKNDGEEQSSGGGFFATFFATTFYEGGFEPKMTRREAALILGVRESADEKRIKDAHRRILVKNHPDRGGSPFIASKVNEAKEFLLKGK